MALAPAPSAALVVRIVVGACATWLALALFDVAFGRRSEGVTASVLELALVHDERGNEALILPTRLGGAPTLFLLDTAYAGAPVVSTSFLAVQARVPVRGTTQARYAAALHLLRNSVGDDERLAAVRTRLLATGACRTRRVARCASWASVRRQRHRRTCCCARPLAAGPNVGRPPTSS